MKAKIGWRIHNEDQDICATMWSEDGGDLVTINGFNGRMEAWMFVATYWVFISQRHEDKATELLREFSSRTKAH
jgi:hypothetical protein